MSLFTIDFEASCLPAFGKSYPIEVGVCEVATGEVEHWLIKPAPKWTDWDWDPEAERLHGLSHQTIEEEGVRPRLVLSRLHGLGKSIRMVSDSGLDGVWLHTMAQAAGASPPFEIEDVGAILTELGVPIAGPGQAAIQQAQDLAFQRFPKVHRAGHDARRLAEVIRILAGAEIEAWLAAT